MEKKSNYKLYGALEYDHITFKGLERIREGQAYYSITRGYSAGVYLGAEYYMSPRVSFVMDIGPSYIDLHDGLVTGVEWIINTGIKFYL